MYGDVTCPVNRQYTVNTRYVILEANAQDATVSYSVKPSVGDTQVEQTSLRRVSKARNSITHLALGSYEA